MIDVDKLLSLTRAATEEQRRRYDGSPPSDARELKVYTFGEKHADLINALDLSTVEALLLEVVMHRERFVADVQAKARAPVTHAEVTYTGPTPVRPPRLELHPDGVHVIIDDTRADPGLKDGT